MKLAIFKIFIITSFINMVLFNNIKAEKNVKKFSIVECDEYSPIKAVIFDLGDVLVTSSHAQQIKICCWLALTNPKILYTLLTKDLKQELFTTLNKVSSNSTEAMYNQGKKIPQIMVDWLSGRPNIEVLSETLTCIAQENNSTAHKKMLCKIVATIFDPKLFINSIQLVSPMEELAINLKKNGYKLYILSNWDKESFDLLKLKYKDFFDIFDGEIISGIEKIGKPNPEIYKRLLEKCNLLPEQCLFIDDESHNVKAAEELKIKGIIYKSVISVYLQLYISGICKIIS